jgi:hypothetical protein
MKHHKKRCILLVCQFLLGFVLINCELTTDKSKNAEAALSLLVLAQTQTPIVADITCPPNALPVDIPIANTFVSGASTVNGFNDSSKTINGICGAGEFSGSLDVYAMNLTGAGATIKLSWAGKTVRNVTGMDFIVYENAFKLSDTSDRYAFDPMVVEVSNDDTTYCGFTLTYDSTASTLNKLTSWSGFGGLRPVIYNMATKTFSLEELFTSTGDGFLKGGGDGFELDNLITSASCTSTIRDAIKANGFKFLKLTSASAVTNPATGNPYAYPHSFDNGSDIDGVVAKSVQ